MFFPAQICSIHFEVFKQFKNQRNCQIQQHNNANKTEKVALKCFK